MRHICSTTHTPTHTNIQDWCAELPTLKSFTSTFSSQATVLVVLETHSKAPFIKTRLSNKALTHSICTSRHTGRVNPGQPNMHSTPRDKSSRSPPKTPTTQNSTPHCPLSPHRAPACGQSRNSHGVIWLCLYKHGPRANERAKDKC